MDEGEDVAVIAAEEFPKMYAGRGMADIALGFADGAACLEGPRDLVVEFDAVGDDDKRPFAGHLAQDLLREEDHGKALAAALRLLEYAAASVSGLARLHRGGDRVVHAEELVILAEHLHEPGIMLGEELEVFEQIQ